jgi:hypothetical protein
VLNYQRAGENEDCDSKLMVTKNRMTGRLLTGENAIKMVYSVKSKRIMSKAMMHSKKEYSCFAEPTTGDAQNIEEMLL